MSRPDRPDATARLLELLALTGFVVAQPIFEVLSDTVEVLLFRQAGGAAILALVALIILLPPLVLWAVGLLASAVSRAAGRIVHVATVAILGAIFVLQLLGGRTAGVALTAVTLLLAGILTGAYLVWPVVRTWLRVTAVAPFVFAALFLFASPVRALIGLDAVGTAGTPRAETSPVVMIVFDELPLLSLLEHGEIDGRLYPNFAALATDGTFFRNATSVAARTVHSLPAMLTGHLPAESIAPVTQQFPGNLFSLLRASHQVHAFESVTALCPADLCPANQWGSRPNRALVADATRVWLATFWPGNGGRDAVGNWFREETIKAPVGRVSGNDATFLLDRADERQPVRFERFLASIDGKGTPFHFIHLVLPHAPWRFLPDGREYVPEDLGLVSYEQRTAASWPAMVNRQRHILQTMYVDRLLGQAVDRLKQVGLYDRAAVVVTTDHGISFAPGLELGTRNLRSENEHEVAWVPLIVKSPGQTSEEVRDDHVLSVDIAPTVADLAGVDIPWAVDGISLLTGSRDDPGKPFFNTPGVEMRLDVARSYPKVTAGSVSDLVMAERGSQGAFTLRPYADLVGIPAGAVASTDAYAAVAHLNRPEAFRTPRRSTAVVPSLVTGRLEPAAASPSPTTVAFVLDGTVVGASELYEDGGKPYRFAAILATDDIDESSEGLEVFVVERDSGAIALRPVPTAR